MPVLDEFQGDMQIAKLSESTIAKRIELLDRLALFLDDTRLLDASEDQLRAFQATFAHLSPASVDIYTRHMRAFYKWAYKRHKIDVDLAETLIVPRVPKALPHPTSPDDLRLIFTCVTGVLRMVYVLATFAGLRRGEICRLQRTDIMANGPHAVALIHGKGRRERKVPLLAPVMDELETYGARRGWLVRHNGRPYIPERLSVDSHNYLASLGVNTTLHSMRHSFATDVGRITKDPMFVRDLLGHDSVATTMVYIDSNMDGAHGKLAGFAESASMMLGHPNHPRLRIAGS